MRKKRLAILLSSELVILFILVIIYINLILTAAPASVLAESNNPQINANNMFDISLPAASPAQESTVPEQERIAAPEAPLSEIITVAFCGDILLDRGVKNMISSSGRDAVFPLEYAAPFLEADIAMVDLEYPISNRGEPMPDKEFTFRGNPAHINFFTETGIDIVTLANNHILDYGYDAFLDTLDLLDEHNIKYVGGGRDIAEAKQWVTFEVNGKKLAFLAASRVVPVVEWYAGANRPGVFTTYDPTALNEQIHMAKKETDYVIVFVHWGVEKQSTPEPYQINMAHGYIDNGADAVVACHPHVLQGFEYYKGKPIAYSLGNFIFTDAKKDTVILTISFSDEGDPRMKISPYNIINLKTSPMESDERKILLKEHLESISFDIYMDEDWNIHPNSER